MTPRSSLWRRGMASVEFWEVVGWRRRSPPDPGHLLPRLLHHAAPRAIDASTVCPTAPAQRGTPRWRPETVTLPPHCRRPARAERGTHRSIRCHGSVWSEGRLHSSPRISPGRGRFGGGILAVLAHPESHTEGRTGGADARQP